MWWHTRGAAKQAEALQSGVDLLHVADTLCPQACVWPGCPKPISRTAFLTPSSMSLSLRISSCCSDLPVQGCNPMTLPH